MRILFSIFIFISAFCTNNLQAQVLKTLPLSIKYIRSTPTQLSYLIAYDNTIYKLDSNLSTDTYYFRHPRLGELTQFDVSNPFKPLAFYANFQTLVFFDKKLNVLDELDLKKIGLNNVSAVCNFSDAQLLIFDDNEKKVKVIDFQGKVYRESNYFENTIQQIFFQGQRIIAATSTGEVLSFDYNLQSQILFTNTALESVELVGEKIFLHMATQTLQYDKNEDLLKNDTLPFSPSPKEKIYLSAQYLFSLSDKECKIFALK